MFSKYLGLEIVELTGCHNMLKAVPKRLLPVCLTVTNIAPSLRDSWMLLVRKPTNWVARKELPRDDLYKILGKHSPYYRLEKDRK